MPIRLLFLLLLSTTLAAADALPAKVKGGYKDRNSFTFDFVDGIARAGKAKDALVYLQTKPIAAHALADGPCGLPKASAMALLRNAGSIVIQTDPKGRLAYFEVGGAYGGSVSARYDDVKQYLTLKGGEPKGGRVAGSAKFKSGGGVSFDVPAAMHSDADQPRKPTREELYAAYAEVRRAALAKDLPAMLFAQGFDPKQIEAIRKLPGIDADFAAHADHFFEPGTPEETFDSGADKAKIGARGQNSKGKKSFNYYEFTPCGGKLLLISIAENQ